MLPPRPFASSIAALKSVKDAMVDPESRLLGVLTMRELLLVQIGSGWVTRGIGEGLSVHAAEEVSEDGCEMWNAGTEERTGAEILGREIPCRRRSMLLPRTKGLVGTAWLAEVFIVHVTLG